MSSSDSEDETSGDDIVRVGSDVTFITMELSTAIAS